MAWDFLEMDLVWTLNIWTIVLYLSALIFLGIGYYLISGQVKLVKKESWSFLDRLRCFAYAILFMCGSTIIVSMMVIFATSEENNDFTAPFIIFPIFIGLIFLTIFPLFHLLYFAQSQKVLATAPPLRVIEKYFINRFKAPLSYVAAVGAYFLLYLLPPLLIIAFRPDIDNPIIVWLSWEMFMPMSIISYYGTKGFVSGLITDFKRIPDLDRSVFLGLENQKRAEEEFIREPIIRIALPFRIFLYFWTMYAGVTTFTRMFPNIPTGFSNMSYALTVYLVLAFGIIGYFSRFWGRRVKFKMIDIMFAGYLIAAVGVNVFVNFILMNPSALDNPLNSWLATANIFNENAWINEARYFAFAAVIEEVLMVTLVTYFFLQGKKQNHKENMKDGFALESHYALITKSYESFDPLAPFNYIKSKNIRERKHASDALFRMYSRIPKKRGYFLNDPIYKDPLMDALCDYNVFSRQIAQKIFSELLTNHPDNVEPLVKEALISPNIDKVRQMTKMLKNHGNVLYKRNESLLMDLFHHLDFEIRRNVLHIVYNFYLEEKEKNTESCLENHYISLLFQQLNQADYVQEVLILKIFLLFKPHDLIPDTLFSDRLDHPITEIQEIAAMSVSNIDMNNLNAVSIPKLISMILDPSVEVQSAAMGALVQIGDFKKNKIPVEPFIDGLFHIDEGIQNNSVQGVIKWMDENRKDTTPLMEDLIERFQSEESAIYKSSLLKIFVKMWSISSEKLFALFLKNLYIEEEGLQDLASEGIVNYATASQEKKKKKSTSNLDFAIKTLIAKKETETIIQKGMIAKTLIKMVDSISNPDKIIDMLLDYLVLSGDEENINQIKINASNALSGLVPKYSSYIDIKKVLETLIYDKSPKVKKELAKLMANLSPEKKVELSGFLPLIQKGLQDKDKNIRFTLAKMIIGVSEDIPEEIPLSVGEDLIKDQYNNVRESGYKLLGIIGKKSPKKTMVLLLKGIHDDDEYVQHAAVDSISQFGTQISDEKILTQIKSMLKDDSKWVRLAAIDVVAKIAKKNPSFISFDEITAMVRSADQDVFITKSIQLLEVFKDDSDKFKQVLQFMIEIFQHPNEKVRRMAQNTFIKITAAHNTAKLVPQLLKYFSNESDILLMRSLAIVLDKLVKYENNALKKRVIAMIKVGVENTQDAVLSEILTGLTMSL